MKKALIIGSTVVDVIVNLVDSLPTTGEDVHVRSQHMSLGGCAYNVSDSVRHFQIPYILFSPVGTGVYGYFVREELKKKGISNPIPSPDMDNGCCYCFVEKSGERTFISYHGAEYLFQKDWFNLIDTEEIDSVYICGLEIEETTGSNVVEFLQGSVADMMFADNWFDAVTAFETVYFWPDLPQCFREVYRVLKPGGTFLICNESNGDSDKDEKWTEIIGGMTIYKDVELKAYLEQAGFHDVQIHKKKSWLCVTARK